MGETPYDGNVEFTESLRLSAPPERNVKRLQAPLLVGLVAVGVIAGVAFLSAAFSRPSGGDPAADAIAAAREGGIGGGATGATAQGDTMVVRPTATPSATRTAKPFHPIRPARPARPATPAGNRTTAPTTPAPRVIDTPARAVSDFHADVADAIAAGKLTALGGARLLRELNIDHVTDDLVNGSDLVSYDYGAIRTDDDDIEDTRRQLNHLLEDNKITADAATTLRTDLNRLEALLVD